MLFRRVSISLKGHEKGKKNKGEKYRTDLCSIFLHVKRNVFENCSNFTRENGDEKKCGDENFCKVLKNK